VEILMAVLVLLLLALCAGHWGADSRPQDVDRATPWWPATPRE